MKNTEIVLNLRLFDGEAGGSAGADTGTAATGPAVQGEPVVVYGKAEDATQPPATGNEGSTTQNQQEAGTLSFDPAALTTPESRAEAFKKAKEFFKDEYSSDFQKHFDRRFKAHKDTESSWQKAAPVIETLQKFFKVNSLDELAAKVESDVLADVAEEEGFSSVEKYREYLAGKKAQEQLASHQREQDSQQKAREWVDAGVSLKAELAAQGIEFDFAEEVKNAEFVQRLQSGMSVKDAYYLTHMSDLMNKQAAAAAQKAQENTVANIAAKNQRIPENGAKPSAPVVRKTDPSTFNDKDMDEIAARVKRGEKIRF